MPKMHIENSSARLLGQLRTMLLIRGFEELGTRLREENLMRGPMHESTGQEAVAVGVCSNLRRTDLLQSNHRGHGHAIAKGTPVGAMVKEILGRVGGVNGGKGGSMHIADFSVGMMGANGILGDGMTLAVGAAQAVTLKQTDDVVTVFVGDGTTNRGVFYETLNWAKVFHLPLLIVCEDNRWASSTPTHEVTAGGGPLVRARAFDIDGEEVDGNDIEAVDRAAAELIEQVRAGGGPRFLHAKTYRLMGHISQDRMVYRQPGETDPYWQQEPIARAVQSLDRHGVEPDAIEALRRSVDTELETALAAAKAAPFPAGELAFTDILDAGDNRWK